MKNFLHALKNDSNGAATLEFVAIFPLILLVMVVIIDLSYVFYVQNQLEAASREGARSCSIANNSALAITQAKAAGPNGGDFTITGTCVKTGNTVNVTATVSGSDATLISYLFLGSVIGGETFSANTAMVTEW